MLTADSPLSDYLDYLDYLLEIDASADRRQAALEETRRARRRQDDAVQLLDQGQYQLYELWQFDLQATPALCAAFDRALLKIATADELYDLNAGERLERELPNIKFFAAGHCNLDASLTAAEARIDKIIAVNRGDKEWTDFLATLVALHRKG
jgi:formate dehydrogenase maturation protein FdhE